MDSARIEQVLALGTQHAIVETEGDLAATMATLVAVPVYEFYPVGGVLRGQAAVRRYYEHLMGEFLPRVEESRLVEQWCNEQSLIQEYDVDLRVDGVLEHHRLVGILVIGTDRLEGERIYGSEAALRRMLGDLFDELEPH